MIFVWGAWLLFYEASLADRLLSSPGEHVPRLRKARQKQVRSRKCLLDGRRLRLNCGWLFVQRRAAAELFAPPHGFPGQPGLLENFSR